MGAVRGRTAFCYLFFFPGGNSVLLTEHWFKSGNSLKKDLCRRESPSGNGEWRGGRRLVQAFVLVRARLFFLSLNLHVYPGMLWLIARNHLSSATVLYMYGSEWWLLWECILHKFRGTFLLFSIVLGLNLRKILGQILLWITVLGLIAYDWKGRGLMGFSAHFLKSPSLSQWGKEWAGSVPQPRCTNDCLGCTARAGVLMHFRVTFTWPLMVPGMTGIAF